MKTKITYADGSSREVDLGAPTHEQLNTMIAVSGVEPPADQIPGIEISCGVKWNSQTRRFDP